MEHAVEPIGVEWVTGPRRDGYQFIESLERISIPWPK
jgi:hypothetical protein